MSEESIIHVAVDVGRSSVKVAYHSEKGSDTLSFPTLVASARSYAAENGSVLASAKQYFWTEVDGQELLFGETAQLMGDRVIDLSEGEAFVDLNIKATLFSVAECLHRLGIPDAKVLLAINLTFQNNHLKAQFQQALMGPHSVHFKMTNESFAFTVTTVSVLFQGYSGALSIIMRPDLSVDPLYQKSAGVIADIGRYTIDFIHVESISPKDGNSYDYGTHLIFDRVSQRLRKQYGIVKETWELEKAFLSGKKITTLQATAVDLAPIVAEEVAAVFPNVDRVFSTFIGTKTPDYVFLLGGGALLFAPHFQAKYPLVCLPENPQFSNAIGMLRFLARASRGTTKV